jgi:hypothetical protein
MILFSPAIAPDLRYFIAFFFDTDFHCLLHFQSFSFSLHYFFAAFLQMPSDTDFFCRCFERQLFDMRIQQAHAMFSLSPGAAVARSARPPRHNQCPRYYAIAPLSCPPCSILPCQTRLTPCHFTSFAADALVYSPARQISRDSDASHFRFD